MQYPELYRAELLSTLKSINLHAVDEVLQIFRQARANGRCIFVCGTGSSLTTSRVLCDMVRSSGIGRGGMAFRIAVLPDELPQVSARADNLFHDAALVEQLRSFASSGDVVVAISASGDSPSLLRALEYASKTGCRTVSICDQNATKLAAISDTVILIPPSQLGSVEDVEIIVCRMIGGYFASND
jgi:D-sedoheptulose 7-phosphate isomerase